MANEPIRADVGGRRTALRCTTIGTSETIELGAQGTTIWYLLPDRWEQRVVSKALLTYTLSDYPGRACARRWPTGRSSPGGGSQRHRWITVDHGQSIVVRRRSQVCARLPRHAGRSPARRGSTPSGYAFGKAKASSTPP
jgi:hypothetical protein